MNQEAIILKLKSLQMVNASSRRKSSNFLNKNTKISLKYQQ